MSNLAPEDSADWGTMQSLKKRSVRGAIAAAVDCGTLMLYLEFLSSQSGPHNSPRVILIACYLVIMAALSLSGGILAPRRPGLADTLSRNATAGNVGLGLLAVASIALLSFSRDS